MLKFLRYAPLLFILFAFAVAIYFYPKLPATTLSPWVLFLLPSAMCVLWGIFLLIPRIDPLKANIAEFRPYYDGFVVLIVFFMIFAQLQLILWSQGTQITPVKLLPFGIGLIFYYAGILCGHAKRNWFIGVRTPWTLTSDNVWMKTNKLGGTLFKMAGILALFGVWFPDMALYLIFVPGSVAALVVVVYSYMEYKKELAGKGEMP